MAKHARYDIANWDEAEFELEAFTQRANEIAAILREERAAIGALFPTAPGTLPPTPCNPFFCKAA